MLLRSIRVLMPPITGETLPREDARKPRRVHISGRCGKKEQYRTENDCDVVVASVHTNAAAEKLAMAGDRLMSSSRGHYPTHVINVPMRQPGSLSRVALNVAQSRDLR